MKINRQNTNLRERERAKDKRTLKLMESQKAHCAGLLAAEMQDQKQSARLLGRLALM